MRFIDITGDRYGRLTVIGRAPNYLKRNGRPYTAWFCSCDCGNQAIVLSINLRRQRTRSCGCLQVENAVSIGVLNTTHGDSKHGSEAPEYNAWHSMKKRCLDVNHQAYKRYGGRGITVCQRWLESYENFLADMGRRPSAKHSLDRVDNNLLTDSYSKSNCRWATKGMQANNRRPRLKAVK